MATGNKLRSPKKYEQFALVTVKAKSDFPLDGLRYDHCMPWKEYDTHSIQRVIDVYGRPDTDTEIILHKHSEDVKANWFPAFWESHSGVSIEPISAERAQLIHQERESLAFSRK